METKFCLVTSQQEEGAKVTAATTAEIQGSMMNLVATLIIGMKADQHIAEAVLVAAAMFKDGGKGVSVTSTFNIDDL